MTGRLWAQPYVSAAAVAVGGLQVLVRDLGWDVRLQLSAAELKLQERVREIPYQYVSQLLKRRKAVVTGGVKPVVA
jgi:hypothetical protein